MTSDIRILETNLAELQAKAAAHRRLQNEGGAGYNPYDDKISAAVDALHNARLHARLPEFLVLRARWNAAVAKHTINGKVTVSALAMIEAEAGISRKDLADLKTMAVEG